MFMQVLGELRALGEGRVAEAAYERGHGLLHHDLIGDDLVTGYRLLRYVGDRHGDGYCRTRAPFVHHLIELGLEATTDASVRKGKGLGLTTHLRRAFFKGGCC